MGVIKIWNMDFKRVICFVNLITHCGQRTSSCDIDICSWNFWNLSSVPVHNYFCNILCYLIRIFLMKNSLNSLYQMIYSWSDLLIIISYIYFLVYLYAWLLNNEKRCVKIHCDARFVNFFFRFIYFCLIYFEIILLGAHTFRITVSSSILNLKSLYSDLSYPIWYLILNFIW